MPEIPHAFPGGSSLLASSTFAYVDAPEPVITANDDTLTADTLHCMALLVKRAHGCANLLQNLRFDILSRRDSQCGQQRAATGHVL